MRILLATCAALLAPAAAAAADIQLLIRDQSGAPVRDAVVSLAAPGRPAPVRPARTFQVEQRDIKFNPFVLLVPVGADVVFPNRDKVRHHVYSFSKPKKFELKLFGLDESRNVVFDKPGAVALGCNIHDPMNGVVYVTASPFTALTDAAGRVRLNVAPGAGRISVWHPAIRAAANTLEQPASIAATGLTTTLQLRR